MAKGKLLRMAGDRLKTAISGVAGKDPTLMDYASRFGFDLLFGGLAAAQTPGDLGDKLIAGGTQTLGGALGGPLVGALGGPLVGPPGGPQGDPQGGGTGLHLI